MDDFDNLFNANEIVGGEYERVIDKNNRFVIPAELRGEMPPNSTLRISPNIYGDNNCLYVYNQPYWAELCRQVRPQITNDEQGKEYARLFATSFVPGKVDVSGRFTLDKALKERANIKDKLVIVSSFNHLEIWALEEWEARKQRPVAISLADLNVAF